MYISEFGGGSGSSPSREMSTAASGSLKCSGGKLLLIPILPDPVPALLALGFCLLARREW